MVRDSSNILDSAGTFMPSLLELDRLSYEHFEPLSHTTGTLMASRKEDLPALLQSDGFIWSLRYHFLRSFESEELAQPAIDDLQKNVYPIYQEARGNLQDEVGVQSIHYEGMGALVGLSRALGTPFAYYRALENAVFAQQAGVDLNSCLRVSNALLEWARRYYLSPEYWASTGDWFLNAVMFALDSLHTEGGTGAHFHFAIGHNVQKAPLSVTLTPTLNLEWELTEESKAKFKKRAMREASKQINSIVNEAFEKAADLYGPKEFIPFKRPQLIKRDMRWLLLISAFDILMNR